MVLSDITVVIPTLRSRQSQLAALLRALCPPGTRPPEYRLLVVLDVGDDRSFPEFVQIERVAAGLGAVKALEAGIVSARTRFVLYLNDDVEVDGPGFILEAMAKAIESRAAVTVLHDGFESRRTATFGLMSRVWYLENCYPVPYRRYFQDDEIHCRAKAQGTYAFADRAMVRHRPPSFPGKAAALEEDRRLFQERCQGAGIRGQEAGKLFLGLPLYGDAPGTFTQCMLKLLCDPPCKIAVHMHAGDSLVARARNSLTAQFLASDCTDLMFIDSDLVFSPQHVARMLAHEELVVGGLYPKKQQGPLAWVLNAAENTEPRPDGLQEVRYVGTGFMRVKREVFERMIVRYGTQICYRPDDGGSGGTTEYDFWSVGTYQYPDGRRRYLSEDWMFCQRWLDMGGKVWADTRTVLKHVGTAVYPLDTQADEHFGPDHRTSGSSSGGGSFSNGSSSPERLVGGRSQETGVRSQEAVCRT